MGTHAKLSPSAAERWFNCPGSLNLIATLPETAFKTSKYAAEGIVAHGLAEAFVQGKLDVLTLTSRVGEVVEQDGFEVEITDAMVEGVIEYGDHIAAVKKAMPRKPAGVKGLAEVRVFASSVDQEVFGTADYILYQVGDQLHVFDFKYGKGVVEAEENKQGLIYLVGAQDGLGQRAFDRVAFHIVQPRAQHAEGRIRTWDLPKERLNEFRKELAEAVARTRDQKAQRHAGAWCKFCPALAYCAEASAGVQHGVGSVFTALPMPTNKDAGVAALPNVGAMTPEKIALALEWEDAIDSWYEAVRERARAELARDPNAVPGYKLVEGRKNRVWVDEAQAETAFAMLGERRYAPRKLLSPTQMEKLAPKDEVAKYAHKPAGELTVAKASDKRQAAAHVSSADAAQVFDRIEVERPALLGSGKGIDLDGDAPAGLFADLEQPAGKPGGFKWPP